MTSGFDGSIWNPAERLSGRAKGQIYAQRAHQVLGEALSDGGGTDDIICRGRIRRNVLAERIGCHRSALRENPRIVRLINEIENSNSADGISGEFVIFPDDADPSELPLIARSLLNRLRHESVIVGRALKDRIVLSDDSCRIDGRSYQIPTIVWPEGIEPEASDWLRDLVVTKATSLSSARQYAKILRAFLRHCRDRRRDWFAVDDDFLRSWRDGRRDQIDDVQIVSDLTIVFQFYAWAETKGFLSFHVGIYEKDELPAGFSRRDFAITARRSRTRKHGVEGGWTTPLTFRVSKAIEGRRNTPNDDQVMSIHEQLLKSAHGERDALIAAWAEEAGPRRSEILQLRKSDLPTTLDLEALIANEDDAEIHLKKRKRNSKAPLKANPFLVISTWDWIETGRRKIVEACRSKFKGYREPDDIFLSSTTGKALKPDSVTKIMGSAFKAAGVRNASLHRLRAKAIVESVEAEVDGFFELNIVVEPGSMWAETVLIRVAEKAGHGSPASLRPYLNFVLNRRLSQTDAERRRRSAEKTRHLERRAVAAAAELQRNKEITRAIRFAREGNREVAYDLLRQYVDQASAATPLT